VATAAEVKRAIRSLGKKLADADPDPGLVPERTILCVLPDLDKSYWAHLKDGRLDGLREAEPGERADARITARSDDLIALIDGRMGVATAFLTGKVRIDAPVSDLLLLRRMF